MAQRQQDFDIFLYAILMTHPGLDFLLETQAEALCECISSLSCMKTVVRRPPKEGLKRNITSRNKSLRTSGFSKGCYYRLTWVRKMPCQEFQDRYSDTVACSARSEAQGSSLARAPLAGDQSHFLYLCSLICKLVCFKFWLQQSTKTLIRGSKRYRPNSFAE